MDQKMNPDVKAKWLEALRSGKYRQTEGVLHRYRGGYCCLGVLCEIAVADGVIGAPRADWKAREWVYDGTATTSLPRKVVEWAGLEDDTGGEFPYGMMEEAGSNSLIAMNDGDSFDGKHRNFAQIADVIEKWF